MKREPNHKYYCNKNGEKTEGCNITLLGEEEDQNKQNGFVYKINSLLTQKRNI